MHCEKMEEACTVFESPVFGEIAGKLRWPLNDTVDKVPVLYW